MNARRLSGAVIALIAVAAAATLLGRRNRGAAGPSRTDDAAELLAQIQDMVDEGGPAGHGAAT